MGERERARHIYREREGRWRVGQGEENGRRLTPLRGLMVAVSSHGFNGEEWGRGEDFGCMKSINGKTKRHGSFMAWAGSVLAWLVDAGARGSCGLDVAGWAQA
jgi:hypothetical protein